MTSSHPAGRGPGWSDQGDDRAWSDDRTEEARPPTLARPVLVTTFSGFPALPVDPTVAIADALAAHEDVVAHVLEVSYERAVEQLDRLVRMVEPVAVVSFAVAADATAVRVERRAGRFDDSPTPDVDGQVRLGDAIDGGPEHVAARLDVDELAAALVAAGVPAEHSSDAGSHVSNHLLRHALTSTALLDRPVGLVHVPPLGVPGFDHDRVAAVGAVVVGTIVRRMARTSAS